MPEKASDTGLVIQPKSALHALLDDAALVFQRVVKSHKPSMTVDEIGRIRSVEQGIAFVEGLPSIQADELVRFESGIYGMAFNLDAHQTGVILLGDLNRLKAGQKVYRTGRVLDVPVGEGLLGRVVDASGQPVDEGLPLRIRRRMPVERPAPGIMARSPVEEPLQTGIKVIDALIPIGRGQRELILGDRQTGKTAIALDTILNQQGKDVICVYCAIGQREAATASLVADLRRNNAMGYTIVVVAGGEAPAGLKYIAPYAATTMAEYFRDRGRDVLIVYDDLTRHARAYRELSLLMRRPPGREAYPGDIFYIHSRLLERSTHLNPERGGGSLTALPIVETQAQNISAYVPTNLVSITDGQIYLSPELFQKGVLPAVDVGKSVSRVGGKAQLPAYRAVTGDLRLAYSQFEELEVFARFGTRLEERTRRQLERGYRVREILKQRQYETLPAAEQIAVLSAVVEGLLDEVPTGQIGAVETSIRQALTSELPELEKKIARGQPLNDAEQKKMIETLREIIRVAQENHAYANARIASQQN